MRRCGWFHWGDAINGDAINGDAINKVLRTSYAGSTRIRDTGDIPQRKRSRVPDERARPISGLPEIGASRCASRVNPTCTRERRSGTQGPHENNLEGFPHPLETAATQPSLRRLRKLACVRPPQGEGGASLSASSACRRRDR